MNQKRKTLTLKRLPYGVHHIDGPWELIRSQPHAQTYAYRGDDPAKKDDTRCLTGYTMNREAKEGDRGMMKYITTPSSGLWYFYKEGEQ